MKTRAELKDQAKRILTRYYWILVLVSFGYLVGEGGLRGTMPFSSVDEFKATINNPMYRSYGIIGLVIAVFVLGPLCVGCAGMLSHIEEDDAKNYLEQAFDSEHYLRNVIAKFKTNVFIILGLVFFAIPGLILHYRYYLLDFVLANHPELSADEAMSLAKTMSDNRKMDFLIFDCSFILWYIVGVLTRGIGAIFYINPYYYTAKMCYYRNLVANGADPLILTGRW